jgi:hypothetical protein
MGYDPWSLRCNRTVLYILSQSQTKKNDTTTHNMPIATAATAKPLNAGIYCPVVSFFKDTPQQELDIETFTKHIEFLGRSGIEGVVVQGSTAEAVALTREERIQVS